MKNTRIQIFRAVAIMAVVMIHTTPGGLCQVVFKPFVNFAVATFLFLSGYLTKTDNDNWLAFYRKRIIRVLVPYLIWTIVYSIPDLNSEGPARLVKNMLSANATTTLYYIFVYIQFVLLTPLLGKLAKFVIGVIVVALVLWFVFSDSSFLSDILPTLKHGVDLLWR